MKEGATDNIVNSAQRDLVSGPFFHLSQGRALSRGAHGVRDDDRRAALRRGLVGVLELRVLRMRLWTRADLKDMASSLL
jgi:hypothetical protein